MDQFVAARSLCIAHIKRKCLISGNFDFNPKMERNGMEFNLLEKAPETRKKF